MSAIPDLIRDVSARELLDDELIETLITTSERALAYVTSYGGGQDLLANPEKLDALRGCLLVMAGAAKEVSESLRNWRPDVPWEDLADLGCWRLLGTAAPDEPLESICAFIRERLPAALDVMREFRTPRTR